MGFLSCVDPPMAGERGTLAEPFPALGALVGFFARVFAGAH